MGVIKAKVVVEKVEEDGRSSPENELLEPVEVEESDVESQPPRRGPRRGNRVPNNGHLSKGTTLALKKGRRSRHRYENEKLLTTQHEDELIWDIVDRSNPNSRFSHLSEDLMSRFYYGDFVSQDDLCLQDEAGMTVPSSPEDFDPEVAYLNIGFSLRNVLKKSVPVGMLSRLEEDILDFFTKNPSSFYIADELSSFERLLAHACSSYHCLKSHSFNDCGKRKLKIGNPQKSGFFKADPCLSSYLQERFGRT